MILALGCHLAQYTLERWEVRDELEEWLGEMGGRTKVEW